MPPVFYNSDGTLMQPRRASGAPMQRKKIHCYRCHLRRRASDRQGLCEVCAAADDAKRDKAALGFEV
jgi:hypothetical protein